MKNATQLKALIKQFFIKRWSDDRAVFVKSVDPTPKSSSQMDPEAHRQ